MNNKITIAIDAMGGENAPNKNIEGLSIFFEQNKKSSDYFFNIYGKEKLIIEQIKRLNITNNNYKIYNTDSIVSDKETPLTAIKNSKNSSMWNAINSQVKDNSNITLSAGNTAVLLVISRMLLKTIDKINKPALAGLWPSRKGTSVVLDLGANVECDENNLLDFSKLGSSLFKSLYPKVKPKVSLLNIGSEEIKGTEKIKKAYTMLKDIGENENFDFSGYIEGNNILNGDSNVIVTDGFTGNVALKTAEGTAKFITDSLKETLTENIFTKFSILFSYFSLKKFKKKLDPRKYNGAIFIGLEGPVVKSHGSTDEVGFYHSIDLCYRIVKGNLMSQIKKNLNLIDDKN
ncbi:MAG: phosphate acyltransferase PlsX [Pelagibacteraceae bacterium]